MDKKGCGIYIQWDYSAMRKEDILPFVMTQKDLEHTDGHWAEYNGSDRDKFCVMSPYIKNLKKKSNL